VQELNTGERCEQLLWTLLRIELRFWLVPFAQSPEAGGFGFRVSGFGFRVSESGRRSIWKMIEYGIEKAPGERAAQSRQITRARQRAESRDASRASSDTLRHGTRVRWVDGERRQLSKGAAGRAGLRV
jgi:hypothetical protein